jgi:GNAT superfamily N-acetyltransferase
MGFQRHVVKTTMKNTTSQNVRFSIISKDRSCARFSKIPNARDVCSLFEACQVPLFGSPSGKTEDAHRDVFVRKMTTALENSDVIVIAYTSDDGFWMMDALRGEKRIVGMGRAVSDGALVATLHDIMVHPEYQMQGIGKRIVKLLTTYLDTRMDVIDVGVVVVNDGGFERFLERSGFGPDDEGSTAMIYNES